MDFTAASAWVLGEGQMGKHKIKFRIALIVVVAVSVVVCPLSWGGRGPSVTAAQVSFVPSIAALELTQTAEGPGLGPVETVEPGATSEETHIPVTDGVWIVEGLTSDEALEGCSQRWGDEQKGMCLAPGGATYYVWLEPNTVMEVVIDNDPTHPWQQHFLAAVLGIIDDRDDILQERRGRWRYWLTADLGALGVIPGCASVLGCIAALGAIALGGGELIQSDARIAGFEASLCTHSRDAVFNYCMMRGNNDAACREAAGYGEPCTPGRIGGPPVGCNPRAPCMPR